MRFDLLENLGEEEAPLRSIRPTRRDHRSRRIDVMKELESGVVDERPIKERFSREFKKAKIKRVKNPVENIGEENCVRGLVVEVHRRTCEVRLYDAQPVNDSSFVYRLSSNIVTAMYRATTSKTLGEFPVVGDEVLLGLVNDAQGDGSGVGSQNYCVVRVLPRKSELKRPGPVDCSSRELLLAANIDQVVIVASVTQPEFNYGFMDRFLLAAHFNNLPFIMVLTKTDLLKNESGASMDLPESIMDFSSIVDKVIFVSAKTGEGMEELKREITGKSSVFSGLSGVGKSTLINAVVPEAARRTGEVRERDGKGRHTTTSSSLFDLPDGGFVIDTPGIRSIGLMEMDNETLAKIFPGFFEDELFTCKYSNCIHVNEPGCVVRSRVEQGLLSKARYNSYLRILNSKN
ncbi:MAG: ribosome small subunit-dependent GTPase A [Fibrobacteraceae bacterium]|nr:ribosome small subunit-dependent GTPase A [Fibrobacteraceae bacterium]